MSALTGAREVVLCYHQEYLVIEAGEVIQLHVRVVQPYSPGDRLLTHQSMPGGMRVQLIDSADPVLMFLKRKGKGWSRVRLPGLGVAAFP